MGGILPLKSEKQNKTTNSLPFPVTEFKLRSLEDEETENVFEMKVDLLPAVDAFHLSMTL